MKRAFRKAFTLMEVVIAIAILGISLTVIVDMQAASVFMTYDAENVRAATMLANEKMMEAQLRLEQEGWTLFDIEESGDFSNFGGEDFRDNDIDLGMEDALSEFQWAYTIRMVDFPLPDPSTMMMAFGDMGDETQQTQTSDQIDLGGINVSADQLSEYLSIYIREIRVKVWWGENKDELDQVEFATHVINPRGIITEPEEESQ